MKHYSAGAPLQAHQPLKLVAGQSAKVRLFPGGEAVYPELDQDGKPHPKAGKAYPGKPFERVPLRDFREDEVVLEEELGEA